MNNIFKPLWERFSRLTYPQKFTAVTVIFILPLIAFMPLILDQATRIDQYGRKELFGTLYLRPLWQLTDDLQTHELITRKYMDGEVQFSEVEAAQSTIEADFQNFERIHNEYRETLPLRGTEADDLQAQWLALKTAVQNRDDSSIQIQQSALFTSIRELIANVGDISYLILDPDLDTYYMMDAVLLKLPENQALLFEIQQLSQQAVKNQSLSAEDQAQLTILLNRIESNLSAMDRNIGVALENNRTGDMRPLVSEPLQDYQGTLQAFANFVNTKVTNPSTGQTATLEETETQYDEARKSNLVFYTAASQALENGVAARVNNLVLRFYLTVTIALLSVVAAFLIGQTIMGSISQPLVQLADAAQHLASGDMTARVAIENTDELGQVANTFNQMAEELERDKTSLIARTLDLESANQLSQKRAQQLQATSEISRLISSEQKLDIILPLVTRLVSEKFDFDHVGIFFTEATRQFVVLQAASSESGKQLLDRGQRLEIGQAGVVSHVALTGKPRVALDSGPDSIYFNTPDLLPDTRSEMALPLNVRGQTIGVLDVQSTKQNAFSENDANTLSILADQVAIAIENARLFGQAQQALSEVESLYTRYLQQEWKAFSRRENKFGYHQSSFGGRLLESPDESNEVRDAFQKGEVVVLNGANKSPASIVMPVKLRGQTLGMLHIKAPTNDRKWSRDEIHFVQAISDRLALALDNARLLQESQRSAAKEAKIGEVTARIGASINMRNVLQTAVEELGRALPGSEVIIQFQNDKENGSK